MLMGAHDGGVNHGPLVVCILRQGLKNPLPHTALAPARMAGVHDAKVAKARRQVAPGNASAVPGSTG